MEINQTIIDALENIEAGDIEALRNFPSFRTSTLGMHIKTK